jgi:hypothetical protein
MPTTIPPTLVSPVPSTQSTSLSESFADEQHPDAFEFESLPEFKAVLKPLELGKGHFAGHYNVPIAETLEKGWR